MKPAEGTRYRIVAFDQEGRRYEIQERLGVGDDGLLLAQYLIPTELLPTDQIASVGVEILTPEGWPLASQVAADQARSANIEVLPLPRLNEPYSFTLTGVDGTPIRSEDYLGSIILLDCWATWCNPCMAKMPQLCASYKEWRSQKMVIIGVNFDQDWERARQAVSESAITWPQINVPKEKHIRDLWIDVSGIRGLPRLLVIDREGYLRADTQNLKEADVYIRTLLEKNKKKQ